MRSGDVKTRLDLVVDRRNKIVHEGDIDPSLGIGTKYPIDLPTVHQAVSFLESLVRGMHRAILADRSPSDSGQQVETVVNGEHAHD